MSDPNNLKTIITTSKKKSQESLFILKYLINFFPTCFYLKRGNLKFKHLLMFAKSRGFRGLIIVTEKKKKADDILFFDLKYRYVMRLCTVSVLFKSNFFSLKKKEGYFPEMILKNFKSAQGKACSILIRELLMGSSNLRSRYVNSFFFSKGFLFIRHHRYIFSKDLSNVKLQEIGPSCTLFLHSLHSLV